MKPVAANPDRERAIDLFGFYAYGYGGRAMHAVRAPFATPEDGEGLVGRLARIEGRLYRIVAIRRQTEGEIAAGDMIGVEVEAQDLPDGSLRPT